MRTSSRKHQFLAAADLLHQPQVQCRLADAQEEAKDRIAASIDERTLEVT